MVVDGGSGRNEFAQIEAQGQYNSCSEDNTDKDEARSSKDAPLAKKRKTQPAGRNQERPFKCGHAGCTSKGFKRSWHLKDHAKTHLTGAAATAERIHRRTYPGCGSAFKTSWQLKQHAVTHGPKAEKVLQCATAGCDSTFSNQKTLHAHAPKCSSMKAAREAKEKAAREAKEKAALDKAELQKAAREAREKAALDKAELQKAAREAKEKAAREANEKAGLESEKLKAEKLKSKTDIELGSMDFKRHDVLAHTLQRPAVTGDDIYRLKEALGIPADQCSLDDVLNKMPASWLHHYFQCTTSRGKAAVQLQLSNVRLERAYL